MTEKIITLFIFIGIVTNIEAVTISGKNETFAGQQVEFVIQQDPFTGTDSVITVVTVADDGSFSTEIHFKETTQLFLKSGIYNMYLYVEPDKNYKVILPEFQPLTQEKKLNPYFKPVDVHLTTENFDEHDLNMQIRMFMDAYQPYYNKHLNKVFGDKDFEQLDKDIAQIDKPFHKSRNKFFNNFRFYKYGMLRFLAFQHKSKAISDQYFKGRPFLYNNPAYLELFDMLYEEYFIHFSRADTNKSLSKALTQSMNYKDVKTALEADTVIEPAELLNMVILKCLYDEFYDDNYPRSALLNVLDSFIRDVSINRQVEIAIKIRNKVTRLLVGYKPPEFKLYDIDSNLYTLESFKGKFVYLNFCSCFSYSCLNEFVMLQKLYERHQQYLEIVTIVIDENFDAVRSFLEKSGYSWKFLQYQNQPEIFDEYDIRAFPTYYLIDNEGKLALSPAPGPAEGFEVQLYKQLKAKGVL